MNLLSLGLSFKTAPVTIREQFSVSENELYGALCKMHQMPAVSECMILSTCNRTEFFEFRPVILRALPLSFISG